jgi:UDP-N-acetylmuramoyl-L-alanyl-D-glutamate--2,6-diaminopimelate ligase
MTLKELLKDWVTNIEMSVYADNSIIGLALDSRDIIKGYVFIALAGSKQHGMAYIDQAINNGARAIIYDPAGIESTLVEHNSSQIPMIALDGLAVKLGHIAARFYGNPSELMTVIGITGTNGKTSCSQFLSQMLDDSAVIGTLGWGEWNKLQKTLNTTPDALEVQRILAELFKANKKAVAIEVSSHGLDQGRINGVAIKGAVYTNISRDHLDYHGTMDAYIQAKLLLLKSEGLTFVVVNLDDVFSDQIVAAVPEKVEIWGFSVKGKTRSNCTNIIAENILSTDNGIEFDLYCHGNKHRIKAPLYGHFNVENVLTVFTTMLAMGVAEAEAIKRLEFIRPIPGRMERLGDERSPLIFVDYAHTPDALDKVLSSIKKHCTQALWVVFGCGGDRDKGKREQMGQIAAQLADHVIIADDNPRYENSLDIVNDILKGCEDKNSLMISPNIEVIQDRAQAIQSVLARAALKDCIVVAGKGHELYQEINGVRLNFSDRKVISDALSTRNR